MLRPETIAKALREIEKGYAQYQYFFDNLNSPAWLASLHGHGFFRNPPTPVRDGQYISFPLWPESRYLMRMARIPEAQEAVLQIALAIPTTENSRVHDDLADIALALPAPQSARLVPQICAAIPGSVKLLLADKVGDLIVYLAVGGEGESALQLAGVALALTPDPTSPSEGVTEWLHFPRPIAHFSNFYYNRIVTKSVPELVSCCGVEAVRLFSSLLDQAISFSQKRVENSETEDEGEQTKDDYLHVACPAIEGNSDRDDVSVTLLCAVRDASQLLLTTAPSEFPAVIALFEQYKWVSFRRLALHLARVFPDEGREFAERIFQQPDVIDQRGLRHEAVLLLKTVFQKLTPQTQDSILAWIDAGPTKKWAQSWLEFVGEEIADEKVQDVIDRRRLEHFSILEGQMPEQYEQAYEDLKERLGPVQREGRPPGPQYGAVTAQSPRSTVELAAMPISEVVNLLRTWEPGHTIFEPTAEGLGNAFAGALSGRATEFAAAAEEFRDLDPTYIRSLFGALTIALKQGEQWDWGPVLNLAKWAVDQDRKIPGRNSGLFDADPDWGWTRSAILELLSSGFEDAHRLPLEYRAKVWEILEPLTNDPDPRQEDEGGENFDPPFLAINSIRGRAIIAVLVYAQWLRRCTDADRKSNGEVPITFAEMPEVRGVLDAHLDVEHEPTLAIRSLYGHYLPLLAALDLEWLRANLKRILPEGTDDSRRFAVAWGGFACFNRPNPTLLPELSYAYRRAITEIGQPNTYYRHYSPPEDDLAEHLMVYYWLGIIGFESQDGLLRAFYEKSPDNVRGHAMWFVGTSVAQWDESTPEEPFERLKQLMDRRLADARGSASPASFEKELSNFGWWFQSEKFEESWVLDTLLAVLRITKKAGGELEVVKLLAKRCHREPIKCVSCLRLMVEGDAERWLLLGVENDAMELLRVALGSNIPDAVLGARRLIEELIARGNFGFRMLLTERA